MIVDNVIENGSADFVEDIAAELPLQAIAEIMGVPQEDRRKLFDWTNRMVGAGDPEYQDNDQQGAFVELFAYANELAGLRRSDPRDDIVTKLLNAEIDGEQLSELEFDMFMLLLAVAGNETTRNATAHGMYAFLTNPEQFELLKSDPEARIDDAVEEILRWASPVLHFRRTAIVDTEIRGQADQGRRPGRHLAHLRQPRRRGVGRPVRVRHHARPEPARRVRRRRIALLPRRQPRPHGAAADLHGAGHPPARHAARGRSRPAAVELHRRHQAHAGEVDAGRARPAPTNA